MNVVVNPWKLPWFENKFFIFSFILWFVFFIYSYLKKWKYIKKWFTELLVFIIWIFIALTPWIWKNIYDSTSNLSISTIISWTNEKFKLVPTKIYSDTEIEEIKKNNFKEKMTSSWAATNEDFWRYFGYGKWINNYVKLPWNLSMQINQWWEYTDIWYIFLALIPLIFIFLPYRDKYYSLWTLFIILFEFLIFHQKFLTNLMSQINLPLWYFFILLLFIIPLFYLNYLLKHNKLNYLFKLNLVFTIFYTFLWTISAFWIVWYWITMYFSFLVMIAICFCYITCYKDDISEKNLNIRFFWSIVAFLIIWLYFMNSVFPHSFNNLKSASYAEYKLWQMNTSEAPFLYHREYLNILYELNIADNKKEKFITDNITSDIIKGYFISLNDKKNISLIIQLLNNYQNTNSFPNYESLPNEEKIKIKNIMNEAKLSQNKIYEWILNPKNEYKNKEWIYRIWTFLVYHISENNKRILDDSLITQFNDYIYNEDPNIAIQNMQDLWLKYLLSDLNAATIDQDSAHNLTTRYDKLLKTFVSSKLELIDTDSMCLQVALEDYKINKDINKYMNIAWVNYESYKDWKTITRWEKAMICYEYIYDLLSNNKISETSFSFLLWLKNYYDENKDTLNTKDSVLQVIHSNYWKSFKVLFKIK